MCYCCPETNDHEHVWEDRFSVYAALDGNNPNGREVYLRGCECGAQEEIE